MADIPSTKEDSLFARTVDKIAKPIYERLNYKDAIEFLAELGVYTGFQQIEMWREKAMKGLTTYLPGLSHQTPTLAPPENSLLYHVGDLPDSYFGALITYYSLALIVNTLPERFRKYAPEKVRLGLAFAIPIIAISMAEIKDPTDIPFAIVGAGLFLGSHLAAGRIVDKLDKGQLLTFEGINVGLDKIASAIKMLSKP